MSLVKQETGLSFSKAQEHLGLPLMPYESTGQSLKFSVHQISEMISFLFLYFFNVSQV